MNLRNFLVSCAKALIAIVIAMAFISLLLCFCSCSSKRIAVNSSSHVADTTHVTIFHDSVRVTLRDTTIINYRDSIFIHTHTIERYDPLTGNITDRNTDKYESIYHEYVDRSSHTIDSLQHIIDSSIDTKHTSDNVQNITESKQPSGTPTSICVALVALSILFCIIIKNYNKSK